jgi:hypothetical protein
LCQKIVEKVCKVINCARLARLFQATSRGSAYARGEFKTDPKLDTDQAVTEFDLKGFDVHHIVPQNGLNGLSDFAQSLLERVGIKADDPDNLAALRGTSREIGKPGYDDLPKSLQERMAHVDTLPKYYYQTVNQRFSELVNDLGGRLPNEAQVRELLQEIKGELYSGGKEYIAPGKTAHARDIPFASLMTGAML